MVDDVNKKCEVFATRETKGHKSGQRRAHALPCARLRYRPVVYSFDFGCGPRCAYMLMILLASLWPLT